MIPVVFLRTCWNRGRVRRNIGLKCGGRCPSECSHWQSGVPFWQLSASCRTSKFLFVSTIMASVALRHSRTLLPAFRLPWLRQRYAAAILPTFLAQAPFNWAIPSLQSLLELFPPFLLAVPKKKVSHSRKSMRSANKGLKDKKSMYHVLR